MRFVSSEQATSICKNIFRQLREVIQCYASVERSDTWQVVDMLAEEEDYVQRHLLEQGLLLLAKLELLSLQSPQKQESAMRVLFKQGDVPGDQLDIDLSRLRLVKRHSERKLELIQTYATMPADQRLSMLHAYFAGEAPLIEPFEMRSDLTEQQQAIVTIANGYHLVKGPAGSGKTTVLEEHVRYLVEYLLVPHDHILVVTHYQSGSDRISNNVKVYQKNGKTISAKTLNNLGLSIFLQNRELLLVPDGQTYYAEKAELRLLKSNQEAYPLVEEVLLEMLEELDVEQGQEAILKQKQFRVWLQSIAKTVDKCQKGIVRLRQHGIFPTGWIDHEYLYKIFGESDNHNWAEFVYDAYCRLLLLQGKRGFYTYDDQILFALVIVKANSDIAVRYQKRYEQIIVDEFQDLTTAQSELIGILSQKHRNVMAFGDDAQNIRPKEENNYRVQSAMAKRFQWISGNTALMQHTLQTNFRSVQEILDVAGPIRYDAPQISDRGNRGEKPAVISVNFTNALPTREIYDQSMLWAMVKIALKHRKALPEFDRASVALMVAKADWSKVVQDCLREYQVPFAVMDNSRYQSQHIRRVLTYYHLIIDKYLDAETEQLLRYCVIQNFHHRQIKRLKKIAQASGEPLLNTLKDNEILNQINISSEQEAALQRHLEIIHIFGAESRFADVWQAINKLPNGPLSIDATDEQQRQELEGVLNKFRDSTVVQTIKDINSHISFVDEHRTDQQLVVTTIDHAKSQAFDTVFLLGAEALSPGNPKLRARLYVSISRARQRFFFLIDKRSDEAKGDDALLPWLQKELHDKLSWL